MSNTLNVLKSFVPAILRFLACLPFLGLPASGREMAPVPSTILVRSCDTGSPTLPYAAERVVAELRALYGLQASVDTGAKDPFKAAPGNTGVIVLGQPGKSAPLAKWCRKNNVVEDSFKSHRTHRRRGKDSGQGGEPS